MSDADLVGLELAGSDLAGLEATGSDLTVEDACDLLGLSSAAASSVFLACGSDESLGCCADVAPDAVEAAAETMLVVLDSLCHTQDA